MEVQRGRGFGALSGYVLSFVMTRFYPKRIEKLMKIRNKNLKQNKQKRCISGESHDEGAFTVFEFIFSEQVQFKMYLYRVVENSMGYPNI